MTGVAALPLTLLAAWPAAISAVNPDQRASWGIDPALIASLITPAVAANRYPPRLALSNLSADLSSDLSPESLPESSSESPPDSLGGEFALRYTFDPALQGEAQRLLGKYNPDYGALVALDPDTGRVLAMASSSRHGDPGNMAMINAYPAASISKIITAVAAVNEGKVAPDSVVPFNGKSTSLYKKSVFDHRDNKWTRRYSFGKSFARSVNTVFGRVGAVEVGGDAMLDYAQRLGFNRRFASDFAFGNGAVEVDTADRWQVAEMAAGYTTRNTLSPLHGAALAAAAVNGGHLVAPAVVEAILGPNGVPLYWHQPAKSEVMRADTARALREMMRATVEIGSSRRSFARFHRGRLKDAVVGGKTGSLTGFAPRGKYDWFVGFGELDGRKIAYAALCINKRRWYVKSARLARELLEFHFRETPAGDDA
ncbi:MAG: penicillin-binding transpeptidase domain-containing protein [bacterium]